MPVLDPADPVYRAILYNRYDPIHTLIRQGRGEKDRLVTIDRDYDRPSDQLDLSFPIRTAPLVSSLCLLLRKTVPFL